MYCKKILYFLKSEVKPAARYLFSCWIACVLVNY